MIKWKRIISVMMAAVMIFLLAACGKSDQDSKSVSDKKGGKEPVTVKLNFTRASTDVEYEWYVEWLESIKETTGGEFDYEIYASESLGGTEDVMEMAAQGQAVAQCCDFAYLANYIPDIACAMSPYLIEEPEQLVKLWQSDLGQEWCDQLAEMGLHVVMIHYTGTRNLITSKPVHNRDDISKLTVRCASTPMWNEQIRVLGGNPTNIPMSEIYQALSQGVADGAENTMGVIYSSKFYEPCKYLLRTEHLVSANIVVMSEEVYQSFSEEGKQAIDECSLNYANSIADKRLDAELDFEKKLMDLGVVIEEADKEEFKKEAENTPKQFPEWSEGVTERVKEAIGK